MEYNTQKCVFSRGTTEIDVPYGIGLNQDLCGAHNTLLIKCWSMIYYTMLNHFWELELFPILPSKITVKKLKNIFKHLSKVLPDIFENYFNAKFYL